MSSVMMLTNEDITKIAENVNPNYVVVDYKLTNASEKVIGYLGEHLKLELKLNDGSVLKCFVKCVPRYESVKADYIHKCNFFKKEFEMLGNLFKKFTDTGEEGSNKWRPKVLLLKDHVFVFEDMPSQGYIMPDQEKCLTLEEIKCAVKTIALFHASSYIYEEGMSRERGQVYRIRDEFEEFLQEPLGGRPWRKAGMKAAIDTLLEFSKHKNRVNFKETLLKRIPKLYEDVAELMKPSKKYRNAVVHRDFWTNNIFLKYSEGKPIHSVIVDFQTVLYASPLIDLSSFLYFTTCSEFRKEHTFEIMELYYNHLEERLKTVGIDVELFLSKDTMIAAYEESILFGLTQAVLIVPLIAMDGDLIEKYFNNPDTFHKINEVCRSNEFIEIASLNDNYRKRIMDLFEELVDRYVLKD